jgi:tetratricopeptide (TPR) repeat protein
MWELRRALAMRLTRFGVSQRSTLVGGLALLALGATSVDAQLAIRRSDEKVLFLNPTPGEATDTAFALDVADEVRTELRNKMRHKLIVYETEAICEVLEQSAYPCDAILSPMDADRLARAMQADAYITGRVWHDGNLPVASLRMVDLRNSGLSGRTMVRGTPGDSPSSFADAVVDTLDNQVKAAEHARECRERLERGDYRNAKERAQRAFRMYANHPAAALCSEVVSEALREPADSQIAYLQQAVEGDSLLPRAWERLGRLYQARGDTTQALDAFTRQSLVDENNRELRVGVVSGAMAVGRHEVARQLSEEWIERNPLDVEMIQLKTRACVEGGIWDCALESLAQQYESDTMLVGDTVFYQQIVGAAQALGDTTAQLEWSSIAVREAPENIGLLRAHASALAIAGMTDSVVYVYEHLLERDPSDYRSALAGARIMLDQVVIDTAVPLDTATLMRAVDFLNQATAATQDSSVLMNVAVSQYQTGSALIQARKGIPVAVELLESAIENDVRNALSVQSNFFLGLGLMFRIFEFDQEVTATESCELVDQEADMIRRGLAALEIGSELAPQQSQQFIQQFQQFEARIPQLRRAYSCR